MSSVRPFPASGAMSTEPAGEDRSPEDRSPGDRPSLIAELRARGVIGVAIVYGVVGWTVVEVASAVFPALDLPDWTVTLVVALVLLGFPIALVLAWAFERTPAGVRRAEAAPGRRVAVAFVLGLALTAALAFLLAGGRPGGDAAGSRYSSLAVLPFEDLSPGDQSYFSEGIAEELMAVLATVPDLDVVGRSSTFAFRDREASLAEVGATLGADVILDGSVRRDGDELRISVQLIDVADGRVLWSRRYDRRAGDIFALQDEIATAVAGEVDIRLSLPPPPEADPARLRAHDLYLRGMAAWHQRTVASMSEAARLFDRAVAADSTYAPAHAGTALSHTLLPLFGGEPGRDHADIAERAARRAIALDPTLAEPHAALSQRALILTWDRATAVEEARRAIELRPSYATAWQWYAEALLSRSEWPEAREAIDRAIELDPLAAAPRNVRAGILYLSGDTDAALAAIRSELQRFPDVPLFYDNLFNIGLCEGDTALIREGARKLALPVLETALPDLLTAIREPPGSDARRAALERVADAVPSDARSKLATLLAGIGEHDRALAVLEEIVADGRDPGLFYVLPAPCFDPVRDDPRFRALMDRLE